MTSLTGVEGFTQVILTSSPVEVSFGRQGTFTLICGGGKFTLGTSPGGPSGEVSSRLTFDFLEVHVPSCFLETSLPVGTTGSAAALDLIICLSCRILRPTGMAKIRTPRIRRLIRFFLLKSKAVIELLKDSQKSPICIGSYIKLICLPVLCQYQSLILYDKVLSESGSFLIFKFFLQEDDISYEILLQTDRKH